MNIVSCFVRQVERGVESQSPQAFFGGFLAGKMQFPAGLLSPSLQFQRHPFLNSFLVKKGAMLSARVDLVRQVYVDPSMSSQHCPWKSSSAGLVAHVSFWIGDCATTFSVEQTLDTYARFTCKCVYDRDCIRCLGVSMHGSETLADRLLVLVPYEIYKKLSMSVTGIG